MTMNVIPDTQPNQSAAAATSEAAPPSPAETPEMPAEPLTPGEAAKAARGRAEERARLERVKRKSDALHADRQKFERERREHAEAQVATEKTRTAEIAELRRELAEYKQGNPLLKPGVDVNAHLRELVAQGTPEAQIIQMQKAMTEQKEAFEARLAEITGATKAREEEEAKRLAEIQRTQDEGKLRQFTLWVTGDEMKSKFKHLNAEFSQTEIFHQVAAVADWAKKNDKAYSASEVADYLEGKAKQVHTERTERRGLLLGAPPPASTVAVTPASKVAQPANGKRIPVQERQKTKEEEIEADLAILRKASEADRIARSAGKK
jgi:hypothetical protein